MGDSDDDVVFIDEVIPPTTAKSIAKPKNRKYDAPNPWIKKNGGADDILQTIRNKLKMENNSPQNLGDDAAKPTVSGATNKDLNKCLGKLQNQNLQTPQKPSNEQPLSLTPQQIEELTENCLDSDNEPELTPSKSLQNPSPTSQSLTPRRALSFNKIKTSSSIRNQAHKFFGAGTSGAEAELILSQGTCAFHNFVDFSVVKLLYCSILSYPI